ncbi:MAG: methyltransferase domain-containing protein [Chitinophagaceae bacterium]|nr:MAG: methyltransferase domain-containing protein [Chitinophagaceae bacterium]
MAGEKLDKDYWDNRYKNQQAGWDIGTVSTPLKEYIDQLGDKHIPILIPGCGNAYEAEYLLEHGFTNITVVDISFVAAQAVKEKLARYGTKLTVIHGDFFQLQYKYQLILEQTFFCAIDPALRKNYAEKMYELLLPGGKLVGLFFNRQFDGGPPFSGNREEYLQLFAPLFNIIKMETAYNSITPRSGTELFVLLQKG